MGSGDWILLWAVWFEIRTLLADSPLFGIATDEAANVDYVEGFSSFMLS